MSYRFLTEILFQVTGTGGLTFPDELVALRRGNVCLLPKGLPYREEAEAGGESVVVGRTDDRIRVRWARADGSLARRADPVATYPIFPLPEAFSYLDRACEIHRSRAPGNAVTVRGLLLAELSMLLSLIEAPPARPPSTGDRVLACQRLIEDGLADENLALASLAAELGCSPGHLSRLFHRRVGERLSHYIARRRIEKAAEVLGTTWLSVKSVSAACGFRDASYFCKVFRRVTGRSPQEFRQ